MKKTKMKTGVGARHRPTIWNRQGNRPTFDSFPALYPYATNFFDIK